MKTIYYYKAAGHTDIGRCREFNEDRILLMPSVGFFAVADGMGQMRFGSETAEMVCDFMEQKVETAISDGVDMDDSLLAEYLESSSNIIFRMGNRDNEYRYGCTFCGVLFQKDRLICVNMGDSRAYVMRKGGQSLEQVTVDHNLAQTVVSKGLMTRKEACARHLNSRLNNFAGICKNSVADRFVLETSDVQSLLLCSDGLYSMVSEEKIAEVLSAESDPEVSCMKLIRMANEAGGKDNISVVCIMLDNMEENR